LQVVALQEACQPFECTLDIFQAAGIAGTDEARTAGAKGITRDHRETFFMQQALAERIGAHTEMVHTREGVECAAWLEAGQPQGIKAIHQGTSALIVSRVHVCNVGFAVLEGLHRRDLADGRRGHNQVLMQLGHCADDWLWPSRVADAPARHRIGLADAAEHHRALSHPRQGREVDMLHAVYKALVNLVGNHQQVMLFGYFGNLLDVRFGQHRARRVIRVANQDGLRAGRDVCL